jgi:hypothetical protein
LSEWKEIKAPLQNPVFWPHTPTARACSPSLARTREQHVRARAVRLTYPAARPVAGCAAATRGWFAPGSRVSGPALHAGAGGGGLQDRTMGRMLPCETRTQLWREDRTEGKFSGRNRQWKSPT